MAVRVRFAPSPTGYLHLGSARTALFNWLYARHTGGSMLLRIEDTDRERSEEHLIQVILDALDWLGLSWDGEVSYQSSAAGRHAEVVEQLLAERSAYRCSCTQEEVAGRTAGGRPGYDGFCRDRDVGAEAPHVVRFRVPEEGSTSWVDVIRGEISFENRNLEDFVLRRRDGTPVFVVANAVDDVDAGVTHVIRGEDLINVTPKVLLLRAALGVETDITFAHLPLIVGEDRKKLSKRRSDVAISDYQARGILPEAMVNYLALLGWGPPDGVEVRPVTEIVELFDIADVNSAPAAWDIKKLESVNSHYIRGLSVADFVDRARPFVEGIPGYDEAVMVAMSGELQTRVKALAELPELVDFFFGDPVEDPDAWERAIGSNEAAAGLLDGAIAAYTDVGWDAGALHEATASLAEDAGLKLGKAQAPIRVAVTGRTVGPPLFESLVVLGRDRTLSRLRAARARC